eukprot:652376-Rhodomonas_salina.9
MRVQTLTATAFAGHQTNFIFAMHCATVASLSTHCSPVKIQILARHFGGAATRRTWNLEARALDGMLRAMTRHVGSAAAFQRSYPIVSSFKLVWSEHFELADDVFQRPKLVKHPSSQRFAVKRAGGAFQHPTADAFHVEGMSLAAAPNRVIPRHCSDVQHSNFNLLLHPVSFCSFSSNSRESFGFATALDNGPV